MLLRLAQRKHVTVPIIVILSETSEATVARLRSLGAGDFLVRGNIQDELLHRILDYSIELGQARQQIQSLSNRDSLTGALSKAYSALAGKKTLSEDNIDEGIRAVRSRALAQQGIFKTRHFPMAS